MLARLPKESTWKPDKTFLDPSCGTGNFLIEIAKRKKNRGHENFLATIYGVDIMEDNVLECRERLIEIAGDTEENRRIVEKNIVCADALKYDFSFGEEE